MSAREASGAPPTPRLERPGVHRWLVVLYFGAAAFLVPWIVVLFVTQNKSGVAYHLHLVELGISLLMVAGMLATALWCRQNSHLTVLAGTATATVVFISAWFATVTSSGGRLALALAYAVVIQLPVVGVCLWTVRRLFRPHGTHEGPPAPVVPFLIVTAVVLVPLIVMVSQGGPSHHAALHLRLVWTGLDVFELLALAATGWCLRRRLPSVAVAGSLTGTLLFCDAWFNVVATTGRVQLAGAAMALVELPLAALSFAVAYGEVRRWPEASPRRALPEGKWGPVEGGAEGAPSPPGRMEQ